MPHAMHTGTDSSCEYMDIARTLEAKCCLLRLFLHNLDSFNQLRLLARGANTAMTAIEKGAATLLVSTTLVI